MGHAMQVLIVDDDDLSVELLRETLAQAGYEVQVARSGREGLEMLRASSCRLVISDWMMPEMDGLELCREIVHCLRCGSKRLEHCLRGLGVVETGHALELPEVNGENPCHHWVSLLSGTFG